MTTARAETDKRLEEMERHLTEVYSRANQEIGEKWRAYMERAEKQTAALQKALDDAKKTGDKTAIRDARKALKAKQTAVTLANANYRTMVAQTAAELSNVNKTAAAYINGKLPEVYSLNYEEIKTDLGKTVGVSFNMADQHTVKRLLSENGQLLPDASDVRWNRMALNAEVTQGIIQGESMQKIARRFTRVVGMDKTSAMRNARTAVTGAENLGRLDMLRRAKELGIGVKKIWSSIHDKSTRDAHRDLDGQEADIEEPFSSSLGDIMYPGDYGAEDPANVYNCRCTLTYKLDEGKETFRIG